MVVLYSSLSALTYGAADFLGGISSRKNSSIPVVAWSQLMGLLLVLAAAPLLGATAVPRSDLLWGMAGGICGAIGVVILYKGLAVGFASIVSPLAALTGAVLPVLFGVLSGEKPPLLSWIGVAMALPAIYLLSLEKEEHRDHVFRSIKLGFLSGLGFSAFFILISRTTDASGMWPLAAARATTVPLFFLITILSGQTVRLAPGSRGQALFSGILDMGANIFFLLAVRTGMIITAAVLTALYPGPTVILQKIFLGEKLGPARVAGLILAVTGAALIGVGG
ncbi:MAG: DMT family transporter [Spirochaetales bacterium]|nr:DMT family transporter [Spirochaetales bacterium]